MDPDAEYEEATQPLEPGETLLLFTDGLIERRGDSIEEVLSEFVATVADLGEAAGADGAEQTAAVQADRILASAVSDTDDDACLVAVRVRQPGGKPADGHHAGRPYQAVLPAAAEHQLEFPGPAPGQTICP